MAKRAKDIRVKPVKAKIANSFVRDVHYSGTVVRNSQVHLGVYLEDELHGVMQFGPPTSKKKSIGIVENTEWDEMIELNRMAFDDHLPKNSESRALSIALKMLEKHTNVKWVVTYADATQCGTGTIYRAANFYLTQIKENKSMVRLPNGEVTHKMNFNLRCSPTIAKKYNPENKTTSQAIKDIGAETLKGYQLRYIYFIDPDKKKDYKGEIIRYEEIDKLNLPKNVRHKEHNK